MKPLKPFDPTIFTMDTWIISDTHIGHGNIVGYAGRPADHNERMLQAWRELVQPKDIVLHLGDVAMTNAGSDYETALRELPGRKFLIPGNHDGLTNAGALRRWGLEVITPLPRNTANEKRLLVPISEVIVAFSHRPLKDTEDKAWDINIHGHIHVNKWPEAEYPWMGRPQVNVSVEVMAYRPWRLRDVLMGTGEYRVETSNGEPLIGACVHGNPIHYRYPCLQCAKFHSLVA